MKRELLIIIGAALVLESCGLVAGAVALINSYKENKNLAATGTALSGAATDSGQELAKCGDANKILIERQKALVDATSQFVVQQVTQEVTRQVPVTVIVKETGEICVVEPTKTSTPTKTKTPLAYRSVTPSVTRTTAFVRSATPTSTRYIERTNTPQPTQLPRDTDTPPTQPRNTDVPPTNPPVETQKPTPPVATAAPTNEHSILTATVSR